MSNKIGTLAEKSLHAALKQAIGQPGDQFEVKVDGFFIDIVRDDLLIEIQTKNFGAMKKKLARLLESHPVLLIHPIPQEKWIVRETAVGSPISRRKSPKKGRALDIFNELIRIPHLLAHPNLSIGIWLTQQEEHWRDDGKGSWRRKKWSKADHLLLDVISTQIVAHPDDFKSLLPQTLAPPFTNKQLAKSAKIPARLAQKITYTLSRCDILSLVGKEGNSHLYQFA